MTKKKNPAKASMTPAAAKAAAPIPPRLAETVTSVLASSISERIKVDMSAIALLARVPTEVSAGPVGRLATEDVEKLWATGGSSLISAEGRRGPPVIVPHDRRARRPGITSPGEPDGPAPPGASLPGARGSPRGVGEGGVRRQS